MKAQHLFSTIPFPFRVQTSSPYAVKIDSRGALFDVPDYRKANDHFWENLSSEGWRTCNAGFAVLVRKLPVATNHFLVLHGLKVKPFWVKRGGTNGISIVLDSSRVDAYANHFISEFARHGLAIDEHIQSRTRALAKENVHEIRSMNTSLYHAGYELQNLVQYDQHQHALAKNIVALSELISARIELADITTANLVKPAIKHATPLIVYRKFDKITKCYIAYAAKRKITITLNGDSRSQTRGIEHFEMIPLIVIDNAVKYSPDNKEVEVNFKEDDKFIFVDVKSLGPKIELQEMQSIFERDVRGTHAINSGKSGNGIGLYFARHLLDSINGVISVAQNPSPVSFQAKPFYTTTFSLRFEKT